jgi:hypothetical protein
MNRYCWLYEGGDISHVSEELDDLSFNGPDDIGRIAQNRNEKRPPWAFIATMEV